MSKHGSILLGELVAVKMVLDFILEKLHQKIQLNKVLILSDSQSSIVISTLGWDPILNTKSQQKTYLLKWIS